MKEKRPFVYSNGWWCAYLKLLFLITSPLSADTSYQDEINAVRLRTATLIDHGRERIDQLEQFKSAWAKIGFYSSELSELAEMRMEPQGYPNDFALLSLHELTFENVLVETLQDRLNQITPKIEEALQSADKIIVQYPDVHNLQNPLKDQVLTSLHELKETLDERKVQVEDNLAVWRQWQMAVALQAEISHQGQLIDQLAVYNDIGQVKVIFNRLWLDTLHKIYERDFPAARQMLAGYAWFKSIVPLYFADKLTTQDQTDFLTDILNEAQEKQTELLAQYDLLSSVRCWRVFAEEEGGGSDREEDHEEKDDSNGDDFPKSSGNALGDQALGQAADLDPGTKGKVFIQNAEGTDVAVFSISKSVCKYDEAGNGTAKITAVGSGFIEHDAQNNTVGKIEMPSGPELQRAIDRDLEPFTYTGWGSVPCGPSGNGTPGIKDQSDKFGKMIDHAQSQAKKEEDKKGLAELKKAQQEFDDYQTHLSQVIQDKIEGVGHQQKIAQNNSIGLKNSLPSPPSVKLPPAVNLSQILTQLTQIRQTMWNWALSSGSRLSHTLGDFIQNQADHAPVPLQDPIKGVLDAVHGDAHPSRPLPKITFAPMTPTIRQAILNRAKAIRDGTKIIKYSKVMTKRTGPDSYDCSGFASSMYAAAGLSFGSPNDVKNILKLAGPNGPFKEISISNAEPGDLIIWIKGEGKNTDDHVAIYDGVQTVHHISAPAVINTSDSASKKGLTAIREELINLIMGDKANPVIHVFTWKNK